MKIFFYSFLLITFFSSCGGFPESRKIAEIKDEKGRVIKDIIAGKFKGDSSFLFISVYDTSGNIIKQYGAKGKVKFKTIFKYDSKNRVIEEKHYTFTKSLFKNYKPNIEDYVLRDTSDNFKEEPNDLTYLLMSEYNDKENLVREKHFEKSASNDQYNLVQVFDTTWTIK